jgi:hypothetical protein
MATIVAKSADSSNSFWRHVSQNKATISAIFSDSSRQMPTLSVGIAKQDEMPLARRPMPTKYVGIVGRAAIVSRAGQVFRRVSQWGWLPAPFHTMPTVSVGIVACQE